MALHCALHALRDTLDVQLALAVGVDRRLALGLATVVGQLNSSIVRLVDERPVDVLVGLEQSLTRQAIDVICGDPDDASPAPRRTSAPSPSPASFGSRVAEAQPVPDRHRRSSRQLGDVRFDDSRFDDSPAVFRGPGLDRGIS